MTAYTLRPALESESRQIVDLIHLVGINPSGLDWKRFIVAVNAEGRVIGCGQIKPHGKEILELASIATLPEYQGQGVARAVIAALLQESPRPLYLICMSKVGGLYERFGFQRMAVHEMPRYFQRIQKLFTVANIFLREDGELLVMKLE